MRILLLAVVLAGACGGHPPIPKNGVVEADLGSWKFRRSQKVLDVEVWVENDHAVAYTASYVADEAERKGHITDQDIVNVFVTRYDHDAGVLREMVKLVRRLAAEQGYVVDEAKIGGARALTINGRGESWVMWAAKNHVVKVGGRGRSDVPSAMVASYADRYPSVVPGGALEGPLPAGPDNSGPKKEEKEPYDPNNPKPDLDKYDPKKSKLPVKNDKGGDSQDDE
ncbi:MAG TPA: hypothetical protein VLX92_20620 [Kofleriaceae bacterium]|nr:hypothetical protein [Kofleriaceae bacterium]